MRKQRPDPAPATAPPDVGSSAAGGDAPNPNGEDHDGEGATLPSSTPGDLGDFSRFAITSSTITRQTEALLVTVSAPGNTDYFRVHPDQAMHQDFPILRYVAQSGKRSDYLVDPGLAAKLPELQDRVRTRRLVPYVTLRGALGLWPIGVEFDDNSWVASALRAVLEAQDRWICVISQKATGQYRFDPAQAKHPEPVWPDFGLGHWLALAFPADKQITNREHPVLGKLRGE